MHGKSNKDRMLRVLTWNFSGLCSERKQKEVSEVLSRLNIDVVAGQDSWEREEKAVAVDGYRWFGKPRENQSSLRGRGGGGRKGWFLGSRVLSR